MTPKRRRALEALIDAGGPVKAYELLPALGGDGAPAKPATAYRALDFLTKLGLVHRIEGLNAFVFCAHGGGRHETALFICEMCGDVHETHREPDVQTNPPSGFHVKRSVVEHYGVCARCQA